MASNATQLAIGDAAPAAAPRVGAEQPAARLRECPDCGQFQLVPVLSPGGTARCLRCDAILRRMRRDPMGKSFALILGALVLFAIASSMTLISVSSAGQYHTADLLSGPYGLEQKGMWELAVVVLIATFGAPLAKLLTTGYVLVGLQMASPPRHLRTIFSWAAHLRPWSMIEVYLLGVFVACVKLGALVHIQIGVALYALGALLLVMVAADAVLDPQAVWEAMEQRGLPHAPIDHAAAVTLTPGDGAIGCHTCGLVSRPPDAGHAHCPRCGSSLHVRKPNSLARTWALSIAALVLYLPANIYPVLTFVQFGAGQPSTILGGVEELLDGGMWPLAALVFFASIAVPMLKLLGLGILLISTHRRATTRLRDRTVLYRIVEQVGRWSMIDVFMISILVALVQFGALVSINPGVGAIAFAGVVILTMFAAESFDPRLMWDAAHER
jgi:paraquat-inducible protein A